ncbi:MAG TPA: glycoside hydrolase family 2 TIM barrel-domain containing protein [Longimicrobiales bacterium]|nr:glycoside hydrolase family 2 TIM barrel-domain containing protein [Longimicrobiales bacterium]
MNRMSARRTVVAFASCLLAGAGVAPVDAQTSPREVTVLQTGWRFAQGAQSDAHLAAFDDSGWEEVQVPHDWAIGGPFLADGDGNTGKLPWRGQGWYRRDLDVPAAWAGRRVYLIFDGVMAFPRVWVNGEPAGSWDYGYTSFYLDITDHLEPGGENVLAVHADTREHDSRWYPGAGIYRKVRMMVVDPVHVDVWGTHVMTPIVEPHHARVRIRTTVRNAAEAETTVTVEQTILSPEGGQVATDTVTDTLRAGAEAELEVDIPLTRPRRWDIDDPALYTVRTRVLVDGDVRDAHDTPFGVRTMRLDPDHGFWLNDRRVQLYGVNLHHGHGPLGAAFHPRAMERKLEIMRSMGANAIRTSHNAEAPEVLAMADSMGLLVFNEVFDKYDGKADITPETDFEEFAHRNIRNFVRRDRNHPSVFLWSVGNEIGDVQWNVDGGFHKLHTMVNYVRKYDPTRPVTLVNDNAEAPVLRAFDYYDVLAWNYSRRWTLARRMEPNKGILISESASTLSTRGFYELPLPDDPTEFTSSLQVSSYDLNAPWWAEVLDDDFMWQQQEPYLAGEFVWTGFDYLGEPTPYFNSAMEEFGHGPEAASRSSYFGAVDLVGIPKDRYWLYRTQWLPDSTTVHILPHWNWPDRIGRNVPVFVYTNGDCAELFLNDVSQGTDCKDPTSEISVERSRLMWPDMVYQPGELRVVAYREGVEVGAATMRTAGEPSRIRLSPDRTTLDADGLDLSYVLVEAFDEDGNPAPLADARVQLELDGPARIAGVGNGNPQNFEPMHADYVDLFYGKAMVIVGAGYEAGRVRLRATVEGLDGDEVELQLTTR